MEQNFRGYICCGIQLLHTPEMGSCVSGTLAKILGPQSTCAIGILPEQRDENSNET